MNKNDKLIKGIGIAVILVLLFLYIDSCQSKRVNQREDAATDLDFAVEKMRLLSDECFDAYSSHDYSKMEETLYDASERMKELQKSIENVANYIRPKDPEFKDPDF